MAPLAAAPPLPPGPRTRVPGGDLLAFRRDPLGTLERVAAYGDVAGMRFGPRRVTLLSDPELVREVLVVRHREFIKSYALQRARVLLGEGLLTSEQPLHLRQRRLAQPAFHRERIAAYAADMVSYAARMAEGEWKDGDTLDVAREMNRLTLAIAGKTLFGAEVAGEAEEIAGALTTALGLYRRLTNPLGPLLDRLPTPGTLRMRRARARLDATIYRIIAERRGAGGDRGDLLSMLLLAQDTEGDGGGMSDLQLRDEALTIFLAGHETTANALAWTWHLLAANPEAEAPLHAELDTVLAGRLPAVDDLPALPWTRAVLAESMRLLPPAYVVGRQPLHDMEIGGFRVEEGSIVLMSPWVIQRDPRWWPEPLRFRPERWTPEMEAELPRFAYFPFGGGPRKCIGEGFAWTEEILVLATLAARWRVRPVPGHPVEPEPMITLRPRHGIRAVLERRR